MSSTQVNGFTQEDLLVFYNRCSALSDRQGENSQKITDLNSHPFWELKEKIENQKVSIKEFRYLINQALEGIISAQKTGNITTFVVSSGLLLVIILVNVTVTRGEGFKQIASISDGAISEIQAAQIHRSFSHLPDTEFLQYCQNAQFDGLENAEASIWRKIGRVIRKILKHVDFKNGGIEISTGPMDDSHFS